MKITIHSALVVATLMWVTPPVAAQVVAAGRPGPSQTITAEDLVDSPRSNLLDVVRAERPLWMRTRGPETEGDGISVYLDATRLGGVEELATLPTTIASRLYHVRGAEAVLRFGPTHADGVIVVETKPGGRSAAITG